MSNIKTINLADHINSAIDKINENFVEVLSEAGLTEEEIREALASDTLDLGNNKILYSNVFPT